MEPMSTGNLQERRSKRNKARQGKVGLQSPSWGPPSSLQRTVPKPRWSSALDPLAAERCTEPLPLCFTPILSLGLINSRKSTASS